MAIASVEELRQVLRNPEQTHERSFELLKELAILVNEENENAQELILRALEMSGAFNSGRRMLDALVRQVGLFPYLEPQDLSLPDRIAYEVHRPPNMEMDVVFHSAQAEVYWALRHGENVVLSAPTSFGKNLIIDAVIASEKFKNILVVVPTIALIDETRRRLADRFRGRYKIITHPFQAPAERNVFVLTQERFQELENVQFDFFVIDEFYKLSPEREGDAERCARLNEVFYRLFKSGKQFYLLGRTLKVCEKACRLDFASPNSSRIIELLSLKFTT